ncbi:hypothetical protein OCU04_002849 [Sclerotinia nivalis]|uniref:Uncharacterized protein n=1 Tax=Sclerotinia nivalis TaxID=352851 RepID=A0A9X0AXV9_9HELO|nr:hypothetical protein OCU04_002849 [Sclerotinia nivalis]
MTDALRGGHARVRCWNIDDGGVRKKTKLRRSRSLDISTSPGQKIAHCLTKKSETCRQENQGLRYLTLEATPITEIHTDGLDSQCLHIQQQITPAWTDGGYAANARGKSIPECGVGTVPIARTPTVPLVLFLNNKDGIRYIMSSNMLVQGIWIGND